MGGLVTKKRTRPADGFTDDEARPSYPGKRRRLQHLDINLGSLELTQNSLASQQGPHGVSHKAKMRPQTRTAAGLGRGRKYFGASQFEREPQDSVELPKVKITPVKRDQMKLDSFDPVTMPRTDWESPSGIHDEIIQDSSPSKHLLPKRNMNEGNKRIGPLDPRPGRPSWPNSDFVIPDTPLLGGGTGR
jgi:hypothetical protein